MRLEIRALHVLHNATTDILGLNDPVALMVEEAATTGQVEQRIAAGEAFDMLSIQQRQEINRQAINLAENQRAPKRRRQKNTPLGQTDTRSSW
ncbi:MAG: hypothetical protein ACPGVX_05700 [Thalassobaculaceae bacterium]